MTNDELRDAHKLDQERRGLMMSSIRVRDRYLRTITRALGTPLFEITRPQIERFLDSRHIGNNTRRLWIIHLHEFYKWAIRDDLTTFDPTAKIVRPKVRQGQPRPADTEELLSAVDGASTKHRCWVFLAAYEGMRCQEIAGLSTDDVREKQGVLMVMHGKGDKQRLVPLHPSVLEALEALPMPRRGKVFRRPRGGSYSPDALSREFNLFLKSAGVSGSAHSLRHWFGTEFYNQTKDLRLTADVMGHANINTTAVYTKVDTAAAGRFINALNFDDD